MKKGFIPVIISIIIFYGGTAWAIPTFGTLMPKKNNYQGGARADFIFERDVKDYNSASTNAFHYTASYGFADWFCIDTMVGLGNVKSEHIQDNKKIRYPYNFSGGYGWRAKLYKNKTSGTDWVFGFQHMSTHPSNEYSGGKQHDIIWDEWQISSTVSKKIWLFTPYCGMKWSFIYLINKLDYDRHRRISNSAPIGLVVGTDFRLIDYIHLNIEARFYDETALNTGFTVRY